MWLCYMICDQMYNTISHNSLISNSKFKIKNEMKENRNTKRNQNK